MLLLELTQKERILHFTFYIHATNPMSYLNQPISSSGSTLTGCGSGSWNRIRKVDVAQNESTCLPTQIVPLYGFLHPAAIHSISIYCRTIHALEDSKVTIACQRYSSCIQWFRSLNQPWTPISALVDYASWIRAFSSARVSPCMNTPMALSISLRWDGNIGRTYHG